MLFVIAAGKKGSRQSSDQSPVTCTQTSRCIDTAHTASRRPSGATRTGTAARWRRPYRCYGATRLHCHGRTWDGSSGSGTGSGSRPGIRIDTDRRRRRPHGGKIGCWRPPSRRVLLSRGLHCQKGARRRVVFQPAMLVSCCSAEVMLWLWWWYGLSQYASQV